MRSLVYFLDCEELLVSIDLLFFHGHLVLSQVQSGQISEPFFSLIWIFALMKA